MSGSDTSFGLMLERDGLRITHSAGDPARHVVSFTGVGLGLPGVPQEEWRKSLGGGGLSVTYVTDSDRAWYNNSANAIRKRLTPILAGDVITLGNSMGGFGAFYFAPLLPQVRRAIAFAPQFSIHPDHIPPDEKRWPEYRERIRRHRLTHMMEHAGPDIEYVAFFGDDELEIEHASRLQAVATSRTHIIVLPGSDHGVVGVLKRAGVLMPLLNMLLRLDPLEPDEILDILRRPNLNPQLGVELTAR